MLVKKKILNGCHFEFAESELGLRFILKLRDTDFLHIIRILCCENSAKELGEMRIRRYKNLTL